MTSSSSPPTTEAAGRADFSRIRYAQVWEDADILVRGLDLQPTDTVVSIASAGDNALALLGAGAARVIALDLNPSQLACVELRVAAYRELKHGELLKLIGSRPANDEERAALYRRLRNQLTSEVRAFWDTQSEWIAKGIGGAGKFEHYFKLFRSRALPLIHGRKTVEALLRGGGTPVEREEFYEKHWNTWRWRLLFRVFFSRFMMGRLGRDPAFFKYVEGSVADRILGRTRHALTALDPAQNPYLHWILTGTHGEALPWALREENFDAIRNRLDRFEWHESTLEVFLDRERGTAIDKYNLSDIFEYMSAENYHALLARLVAASRPGGRLAYWNMLAPRRRPEAMANRLISRDDLALPLFAQDKAYFYSAFVIEEVR